MTFKTQMTEREFSDCTDVELQRMLRLCRAHAPRFYQEREMILREMGRRVADEILLREAIAKTH